MRPKSQPPFPTHGVVLRMLFNENREDCSNKHYESEREEEAFQEQCVATIIEMSANPLVSAIARNIDYKINKVSLSILMAKTFQKNDSIVPG